MRTSYGYDTYRGRTKLQTALTALIIILLVVLLLAVAAFFFLQRYMVYTDDGQAHLELPFLQQETPVPPVSTQDQPLVIVTPAPAQTVAPTPTPAPTELPAVAPVALFRAAVTEGSAQRLVTAAGGSAALLNMKANDGSLGYVSALPWAISAGTSAADPLLNDQLGAVTGSELYTIARVSCFKDNLAPKVDNTLAIKTNSGYNWRDGEDTRWMNPTVPAARQYVTGVCAELADMGFDEILLDNSGWPTTGHLEYIRKGEAYDPTQLTAAIETFYGEVREALKDKNVLLSVSVNAAALAGTDSSGQTAALLGQYADRVYVLGAESAGACDQVLSGAGLAGNAVVYVEPRAADLSTTGKLITAAE